MYIALICNFSLSLQSPAQSSLPLFLPSMHRYIFQHVINVMFTVTMQSEKLPICLLHPEGSFSLIINRHKGMKLRMWIISLSNFLALVGSDIGCMHKSDMLTHPSSWSLSLGDWLSQLTLVSWLICSLILPVSHCVCKRACVSVYVYVCMRSRLRGCECVSLLICERFCLRSLVRMFVYIETWTLRCVCLFVCVCVSYRSKGVRDNSRRFTHILSSKQKENYNSSSWPVHQLITVTLVHKNWYYTYNT